MGWCRCDAHCPHHADQSRRAGNAPDGDGLLLEGGDGPYRRRGPGRAQENRPSPSRPSGLRPMNPQIPIFLQMSRRARLGGLVEALDDAAKRSSMPPDEQLRFRDFLEKLEGRRQRPDGPLAMPPAPPEELEEIVYSPAVRRGIKRDARRVGRGKKPC